MSGTVWLILDESYIILGIPARNEDLEPTRFGFRKFFRFSFYGISGVS